MPRDIDLVHLSDAEQALYRRLRGSGQRLEQEHLSREAIEAAFSQPPR